MAKGSITILGAGPAGLAVGYFCKKEKIPFTILEASNKVGGTCSTIKVGKFRFDTGAHRFHDKSPFATAEVKKLLGKNLISINVPSYTYCDGKLIDFPLSPLNLVSKLGPVTIGISVIELVLARLSSKKPSNFEEYALKAYGKTIAEKFLLRHSSKLWGLPCNKLSLSIAGTRLKGLNLSTFVKEFFFGGKAKTSHLDGTFLYPKYGIGQISDALARGCGKGAICYNDRVTRIFHKNGKIESVEINGRIKREVDYLVSTLPLNELLSALSPTPPLDIMKYASKIKCRNLALVVLLINKPKVIEAGTIYFSDESSPMTRIYEPKNRSPFMSPKSQTSLVAEIPFQTKLEKDEELIEIVLRKLQETGLILRSDVFDSFVVKLCNAYPILSLEHERAVDKIKDYLAGFRNLQISGRNGKFTYSWLHDMIDYGKEIVDAYVADGKKNN